MPASPDLHRSPATLDKLLPIVTSPKPPPAPAPHSSGSPIRQFQVYLPEAPKPEAPPEAPRDHASEAANGNDFTTPTDDAHLIPAPDALCDCPPAPRKPRPSASAGPACRRRLIHGELLRIPADQVERLFGGTWTRTSASDFSASVACPALAAAASGPAVLPVKKRKRCYA